MTLSQTCDRGFAHRNHLNTHMATHSTELTSVCYLCGDRFKCDKYLTKHLKKRHREHRGDIKCHLCPNKYFEAKKYFNHHLKVA